MSHAQQLDRRANTSRLKLIMIPIMLLLGYMVSTLVIGHTPIQAIAFTGFLALLAGIALEDFLRIHKAAVVAIGATGLAVFAGIVGLLTRNEQITTQSHEGLIEIMDVIGFLLFAMSQVERLDKLNFFAWIRSEMLKRNYSDRKQSGVISALTFLGSTFLDNMTVSLVSLSIQKYFYAGSTMLIAAVVTVVEANAGGSLSPIGDIPTLQLWLAGKFSAAQIIMAGSLPAILMGILTWLLYAPLIKGNTPDDQTELNVPITRREWWIILVTLSSFFLPLAMTIIKQPPFIGLMLGFGLSESLAAVLIRNGNGHITHFAQDLKDLMEKLDHLAIVFFIGLLYAVKIQTALGVLDQLSSFLLGDSPSTNRIFAIFTMFGFLSSWVDNVGITQVVIDAIVVKNFWLWVYLSISLNNGGSLLSVGSVSGVVAMERVPDLTFMTYLKIVSWRVPLAFIVTLLFTYLEYRILA